MRVAIVFVFVGLTGATTAAQQVRAREANERRPSSDAAPGGRIRGVITDSAGGFVPNVEVRLDRSGPVVFTDSAGAYNFLDVSEGIHQVGTRKIGYRPMSGVVTVRRSDTATLNFVFATALQELATVTVTANPDAALSEKLFDFYRRQKSGLGTYFTRADIERHGSVRAALGTIPGVRLITDPGGRVQGLRFTRCIGTSEGQSPVAYFVNGLRVGGGAMMFLSDGEIEGIEIYRGPGTMPPEAVGNACAAVFIWTK